MAHRTGIIFAAILAMALSLFVSAPALAQAEFQAVILTHEGDILTVRREGATEKVRVNPDTKIQAITGALKMQRETRPASQLIAGLVINVTGTTQGEEIIASQITFKPKDLRTARQVHGGLYGTQEELEATNKRLAEAEARLNDVGNLAPVGRAKVFFKVGKSTLDDQAKVELHRIADQAKAIKGGFRLAVVGRADPTGNAAANQRLSEARAAAVTAYLMQAAGVRPGSILPSTALGESHVADDPDPPKSDSEARRVTVTILVSKSNTEALAAAKP